MNLRLAATLQILKAHEADLRRHGVCHAALFGSVARDEADAESDIDVLIELDPSRSIGIFEYARLKLDVQSMLGGAVDVVNRKTLKPLLRESILRDSVYAF